MSSTGFEALPPRAVGRAAKRRKVEEVASAPGSGSGDSASSSSSAPSKDDEAVLLAYSGPIYAGADLERYEYLDHTADVQIHGWGDSLADAFAQTALGVMGYMCDPESIKVDPECSRIIEARGRDMCSLLFAFLDACLTAFHCDDSFIARDMRVVELRTPIEGLADGTVKHQKAESGPGDDEAVFIDSEDREKSPASVSGPSSSASAADSGFYIKVAAFGERFVFGKHPQGTEVKAITYSNMQVIAPGEKLFTANDNADKAAAEDEAKEAAEATGEGAASSSTAAEMGQSASVSATHKRRAPYEVFVIVDI